MVSASDASGRGQLVGAVIVAAGAATTVIDVLDGIPESLWSRAGGIWVGAEPSSGPIEAWCEAHPDRRVTVVRQEVALGPGGQRKAGLRWATALGLDAVAVVDSPGAPLKDLLRPITEGDADVVLGAGPPTHRVLRAVHNAVTGAGLSGWPGGCRAYRTSALQHLRLEEDSDGADFDTEVVLQALSAGLRIVEVPVGTATASSPGARAVLGAVGAWKLQQKGFGTGHLAPLPDGYAVHSDLDSSHRRLLARLAEAPPSEVLDIGCGDGTLAALIREQGHRVTGLDAVERDGVRDRTDDFHVTDLDAGLPSLAERFDLIIAADILEHLRDPGQVLRDAQGLLRPGGRVLLSVPNVAHAYPRLRGVLGRFGYDQRGILDATHLRFFTVDSIARLARSAGYVVLDVGHTIVAGDLTGSDVVSRVQRVGLWVAPSLFAYQLILELAVPRSAPAPSPADDHVGQQPEAADAHGRG